jgi:NAD(P)-dependent dehydrogenase (short-subunit alcohol dehydrogenase family)
MERHRHHDGSVSPDRVLLVTGASSGIGRAVAERAAGRGDALVLVAREPGALQVVGDRCRVLGAADVVVEPADVGDDDAVARLVEAVLGRHERIDAVVHAAGVVAYGRLEDVPADVFDGVIRTNVSGTANLARHVVPVLRAQRQGHLLLIGSVLGDVAAPLMTPYAVSKWAVRALGRQLHLENRDLPGVHVSVVSPGSVDTPIYELAGNYLGFQGRPPPPVTTPERVATVVLGVLDRPRPRRQVGLGNDVMRAGFTALPAVYDALVGPLFAVAAVDRTTPVPHGPGAVLSPAGHALRGSLPGPFVALRRNLVALTRERRAGAAR